MAMEEHEIQEHNQKGKGLAWVASVLVSLCSVWMCVILARSTGIFGELFKGLGVEPPSATRFLVATYSWLYPIVFIGSAILVIAKEFMLRDVQRRLAVTVIIFVVAMSSAGLAQYLLSEPLLDLVQKLNK
jgi:hypothetical protein